MTVTITRGFLSSYLAAFDSIDGMFSPDAALLFMAYNRLIADVGIEGDVIEIGVHHGLSTIAIASLRGDRHKLLAVDLFESMQSLNVSASGSGNEERFRANMSRFFPDTSFIETYAGLSSTLSAAELGTSYSFCHIDGGHSAEETLGDLRLCAEICLPGGLIALDDYFNPSFPGVCEGAVEFMLTYPGVLKPLCIGFNKVLFQRSPEPFDLNERFREAYPFIALATAEMWGRPVFHFGAGLRSFVDVERSSPTELVPNSQFVLHAELESLADMPVVRPGQTVHVPVRVMNLSSIPFSSEGSPFGLSYHLLTEDGSLLQFDNMRHFFQQPLGPGEAAVVDLPVLGPETPGTYVIEIDIVWEGVAWLKDRGSPTTYQRFLVGV